MPTRQEVQSGRTNLFKIISSFFNLSDSWVILRSQEKEELKVIENPPANCKLTHDQEKWCEDEDDWGIPSRCVIFLSLDPLGSTVGH